MGVVNLLYILVFWYLCVSSHESATVSVALGQYGLVNLGLYCTLYTIYYSVWIEWNSLMTGEVWLGLSLRLYRD